MKASFGIVTSLLAASAAAYPQVLDALSPSDMSILKDYGNQAQQAAANPQAAAASPGTLICLWNVSKEREVDVLSRLV